MASTHVALITAGGTSNRRIASSLYGYCSTGASTVAKTVSLYTGNGTTADGSWTSSDLFPGLTITVRFRYSNTATNPTLNVNSTGAKSIYKYGTTAPGDTATTSWQDNSVISLTYDTSLNASGCWVMNDHLDDTTGGSGSVEYTLSGSGDDDEYTITATPTVGSPTSATIPAATQTDAGVMTAADKTKLDGIATGAEVNVQSDWNQTDTTADDYIKNKPTIPTISHAVRATLTRGSSMSSGLGSLVYDSNTGMVVVNFSCVKSSNISTSEVLFNVPSAYRPSSAQTGSCMVLLTSGGSAGQCNLATNGNITQGVTGSGRSVFGSILYVL